MAKKYKVCAFKVSLMEEESLKNSSPYKKCAPCSGIFEMDEIPGCDTFMLYTPEEGTDSTPESIMQSLREIALSAKRRGT